MQLQKKSVPLHRNSAIAKVIGLWCNGNTADSGPAFPGSSPGSPTFHQLARASLGCRHHLLGLWCNGNTADSGPAFPGSSPGSPTKQEESLFITSKLSFLIYPIHTTPYAASYSHHTGTVCHINRTRGKQEMWNCFTRTRINIIYRHASLRFSASPFPKLCG